MKDGNIKHYIVDASYVLSFLMTDEGSREVDDFFDSYVDGTIQCVSSNILPLEVFNALVMAVRRKRITQKEAQEVVEKFLALHIPLDVSPYMECFFLAFKHSITVYDASYLALAISEGVQLKTHDKELKKITEC